MTVWAVGVPKSGCVSVAQALEAALAPGDMAPGVMDLASFRMFSDFAAFDEDDGWARRHVMRNRTDMLALTRYRAVVGHLTLPAIAEVASPAEVFTVLREPRARLISLYLFFRMPGVIDVWAPYDAPIVAAARGSLQRFLLDPEIAAATDNQVCRMLLGEDRRIPQRGFIRRADAESVAASAYEALDGLGLVGVLESGGELWREISELAGVEVKGVLANQSATPEAAAGAGPVPPLDLVAALTALERRTVADSLLYVAVVAARLGSHGQARRYADTALTRQLHRFDEVRRSSIDGGRGSSSAARPSG